MSVKNLFVMIFGGISSKIMSLGMRYNSLYVSRLMGGGNTVAS